MPAIQGSKSVQPLPAETIWKTGRRNPAFAGSELERRAFRAMYRAIERMLDAWKIEENQTVDAYALKELKINPDVLRSVTNGLQTIRRVHEIVEITVIKYWYDLSWQGPHLPSDLVLGEYSLRIPLEIMLSTSEVLINVEVMSLCSWLTKLHSRSSLVQPTASWSLYLGGK